jgi:hypothetical protein
MPDHKILNGVSHTVYIALRIRASMIRNQRNEIYGIWFYEKKDCENVGQKVMELVQELEETASQAARHKAAGGHADLSQMLQVPLI